MNRIYDGPTEYKTGVKVTFCAIQECALSLGSSVKRIFYFFGAIGKFLDYLKRDLMYWQTSQGSTCFLSFLPLFSLPFLLNGLTQMSQM